jgi:hypothetical protein
VEAKKPFLLVTLAILLAGLILLGLSDTSISIADTGIPDNEAASNEPDNSSATATITITMYSVASQWASKLT